MSARDRIATLVRALGYEPDEVRVGRPKGRGARTTLREQLRAEVTGRYTPTDASGRVYSALGASEDAALAALVAVLEQRAREAATTLREDAAEHRAQADLYDAKAAALEGLL